MADNFLNKIPKTADGFQLEEIDGEILLYSPASTRSIYLNPTASIIWQLCDGNLSVQTIIDQLSTQFPEAATAISKDVPDAIQSFLDNEAIHFDDA